MKKYNLFWVFIACTVFTLQALASAGSPRVLEPFQSFDDDSSLTISYVDLTSLLDAVVLNTGR